MQLSIITFLLSSFFLKLLDDLLILMGCYGWGLVKHSHWVLFLTSVNIKYNINIILNIILIRDLLWTSNKSINYSGSVEIPHDTR